MIKELFMGNQEICHSRFNFYWSQKERKEIRIMITIQENLADQIMMDHKTDPIHHL